MASFDKALEIKPDKHEAWNSRGHALRNLGRGEEAIASYDKALEIKPDFHPAFYNKACCYALQSQIDQAVQNLQQAINLNPDKYREMAKTDSDFDSIRSHTRFQALIQE
ncbi:TPR end-of-group domain-containing protein [Microcoleus asticus]|uniref:TPR end-of-group domain-containing protein n=1 Tax=Microcoleus asticus TaxID=2815231 RepID=UPI0030DA6E84